MAKQDRNGCWRRLRLVSCGGSTESCPLAPEPVTGSHLDVELELDAVPRSAWVSVVVDLSADNGSTWRSAGTVLRTAAGRSVISVSKARGMFWRPRVEFIAIGGPAWCDLRMRGRSSDRPAPESDGPPS